MALSKERFEQLIARSTDIVVATDRKGTVIYYNDGAKRTLGYSADEVLGTFVARLYPDLAEAKRVMAAMRSPEHGGPGIVETFRTRFLSKKGEEIPVAISGTILRDEGGAEDGTVGFAKDLREILRRDKLATLGEVAIGLSHEINNPLAVIVNQLDLLDQDIFRLAGERDSSVETERTDAIRREVGMDQLRHVAKQPAHGIGGESRLRLRLAYRRRGWRRAGVATAVLQDPELRFGDGELQSIELFMQTAHLLAIPDAEGLGVRLRPIELRAARCESVLELGHSRVQRVEVVVVGSIRTDQAGHLLMISNRRPMHPKANDNQRSGV